MTYKSVTKKCSLEIINTDYEADHPGLKCLGVPEFGSPVMAIDCKIECIDFGVITGKCVDKYSIFK